MKLTLILDPAQIGVRASVIEEWEEPGGTAKMDPRVRLFDSDDRGNRCPSLRAGISNWKLTLSLRNPFVG